MTDTVRLEAQVMGTGVPLLILHGLFGSGRNWGGIARQLVGIRQIHLLDARNHGTSPWAPTMSYPEMAADVAAYMEERGIAQADVLGHSMGGKTAMTLTLARPALVSRLIVVDIAPVAYHGGAQDPYGAYIHAMRGLDVAHLRRRAEADAALAPAIPDATLRAFLVQNLEADGSNYRWRVNLDGIEANLGALTDFAETDRSYPGPVTVIAGELSDYVRPRDEAAVKRYFPAAKIQVINGSGHWPHADHPDKLLALVNQALA